MSQTCRFTAILAAHMAGYSRLMGGQGRHARRLKALRREFVDPKITQHHRRIVKTTAKRPGGAQAVLVDWLDPAEITVLHVVGTLG